MSAEADVRTVLVVDDDSIFHFLMEKILIRLGINPEFIQTALSGKHALDIVVEAHLNGTPLPGIIFLDLNMPMMGGFEFLEAFKKLPLTDQAKTKVVIISSSLNDRDADRALQLGASRFLIKPVSDIDIKQALALDPY